MFRTGKWVAAVVAVGVGFALAAQEPRPSNSDSKPVDLTALRDALDTAARRGGNVDEVRKALAAFEKAQPTFKPGGVPAELQALRDAVDAAARKGESVAEVEKELAAVETAVTGRPLAKPKQEPPPDPRPDDRPRPFNPNPRVVPFPLLPAPNFGGAGGIDVAAFQKATDLYMKALDAMANNPNDADALKMLAESSDLMMKALGGNGGGLGALGGAADLQALLGGGAMFADLGRVPERARLGVRMEKLNAVTAEQLGLEANVGIAVAGVVPGSAAEKAGLKANDIILAFGGKPVSDNPEDFIRQVNGAKGDEKIDLVVMRKGKKVDVKGVVLPAARPRGDRDLFPALPVPRDRAAVLLRAPAEEPTTATPDLADLRDALAAADKRGANVGPVRDALAAFEKAQAKGAAKPGEAPPELTALRAAVEDALKKGENVSAVAAELARVEKAITGREYERPKPPEAKLDAEPLPPRGFGRGGFGRGGFGGNRIIINGGGFDATSVTVVNDNFTIKARHNDVTYTITGTTDASVSPKIVIKDGDTTTETDDMKKVPDAHRPTVERLLKMVNRR